MITGLLDSNVVPMPPAPAGLGQPPRELPVTRVAARSGWIALDPHEFWRFRELLFYLTWRDIKVRYKQTALGVGWAILQPLATMLVLWLVIGRMGGVVKDVPINYPLFVMAAILPWTFFANSLSNAGMSVIQNQHLVTKVYFPRLLVPLSAIGAAFFDFVISLVLLVPLMVYHGQYPGGSVLLAPVLVFLLVLAAIGFGAFLAALVVVQRDFKYVLNFGVQLWLFATPCIFLGLPAIGDTARGILPLNPAYGLLLNFRSSILNLPLDMYSLWMSSAVALGVFFLGTSYFRRVEKSFADVI